MKKIYVVVYNVLGDFEDWHEAFRLRIESNGVRLATCAWFYESELETASKVAAHLTPGQVGNDRLGLRVIRMDLTANDVDGLSVDGEVRHWLSIRRSTMPSGSGSSFV